jgi:hypothetical protein
MKARAREGFARAFSLRVPPRGLADPEGLALPEASTLGLRRYIPGIG